MSVQKKIRISYGTRSNKILILPSSDGVSYFSPKRKSSAYAPVFPQGNSMSYKAGL